MSISHPQVENHWFSCSNVTADGVESELLTLAGSGWPALRLAAQSERSLTADWTPPECNYLQNRGRPAAYQIQYQRAGADGKRCRPRRLSWRPVGPPARQTAGPPNRRTGRRQTGRRADGQPVTLAVGRVDRQKNPNDQSMLPRCAIETLFMSATHSRQRF